MTSVAAYEQPGAIPSSVEPLTFFARVAQTAIPPETMASLAFQLASAAAQLGSYLRIRGDECVEHHYGAALTLACLEPLQNDLRPYQALLHVFTRFDRRSPNLPGLVPAGQLRLQKGSSLFFIQHLRDQRAFQTIYEAARQIDTYGARSHAPRKIERIILLSRELAGKPLLAPPTAPEQLFTTLASA